MVYHNKGDQHRRISYVRVCGRTESYAAGTCKPVAHSAHIPEEVRQTVNGMFRCQLGEDSKSSAGLGLSREGRGRDKVAASSAHSTSPGPRVTKVVAPHDRVRKQVQIARTSRPVFRAIADSSESPTRGTTYSSPVRDERRRPLRPNPMVVIHSSLELKCIVSGIATV